jgi:tripartite-type tricarboxylate transporter receptor subunit TctC
MKFRVVKLLLAVAGVLLGGAVFAQAYPSKPVTVIVGYPPGGSTDLSTRVIAEKLTQMLGQPFVVVNRPGAAGNIGTAQAARSAPDGYTLVHGYVGTIAIHPALYGAKLPYQPAKELTPVAPIASVPTFLVVPLSLGVRSVAELIAMAKAKPGQVTYGTAGSGSTQHLFAELFRASAGIDVRPIPFGGSGPANVALLGSHINFMFDAGQVVQQVAAGQLVGLATTAARRLPNLPDLPAVSETFPGFEATSWHGIFAPAGTPGPIIDLLNAKITEALAQPDTQKRLGAAQMSVMTMSPLAFASFIREETAKWASVVKATGIQAD